MRSEDYMDIVDREKTGCFAVPMVHSAILFDMRREVSQHFSYSATPPGYKGPRDDIILLAHNVKAAGWLALTSLCSQGVPGRWLSCVCVGGWREGGDEVAPATKALVTTSSWHTTSKLQVVLCSQGVPGRWLSCVWWRGR